MNTAELARKLPFADRIALLRLALGEATTPTSLLTTKKLVNVVDGESSLTDLGVKVARHLDAGHRVQVRGRITAIVARVWDAQTVDAAIEQAFRQFTTSELDQAVSVLSEAAAAARAAGKD